ncbi:MAG: single-stranded-DNA-specific exonuclease RecJ [Candidatus Uhrbacteria bacterium]
MLNTLCFQNLSDKHWLVSEPIGQTILDQFPEINPVILQLLWNRGVCTQEEIDVFLGPDYSRDVHSPWLFRQMRDAVTRVFEAIKNDQVITIHGDYDADGVCATVILFETVKEIMERMRGIDRRQPVNDDKLTLVGPVENINIYIPHREKEGYGLSVETVEHLHKMHTTNLIITVDCGISNDEAIARGNELGIDTIITDHHDTPEKLPEAIIIHPRLPGETYPYKELSGTAVAFKLAHALIEEAQTRGLDFPKGHEKWLLDLVAIATVTDVMQMTGENRTLEKFGLLVMNKTKRIGLQKLVEVAGIKIGQLDSWNIGWQIGPRINAAGRVNHATLAFELLTSEDEMQAHKLAEKLDEENRSRQSVSGTLYAQAKEQIGQVGDQKLLIAVGEDWPLGIVGLAAGKLSAEYYRPVFVVSCRGEDYSASGRSIPELNITEALKSAAKYLHRFGGHPQACGFTIRGKENFERAMKEMTEFVELKIKYQDLTPKIEIDSEIILDQIDWGLIDHLDEFRPYGQGNEQPLFLTRDLLVISAERVGNDGQHLRLSLNFEKGGKIWKAIAFRLGDRADHLELGTKIDIIYELGINEWNGNREIQIKIKDLKYAT